MKTLRALKITSALQILFCLFCIASSVCFGICHYVDSRVFFDIGNKLIYGWVGNPIGPVSFCICILLFAGERKDPESRALIGRKWIWIFIWPAITTIFYLTSAILTVVFTGGV